ncbi:hypothetical protein Pmani_028493 [Petrolisthes manimaculis]|uniref:Uncharacterized protein n=1 Tax=Petrolisthes manimaculis TaxID=1843537 RepID=A0AAE1P014_9EUCA|nr:hypothetical protein Pmani_028493 [Petrolisthes manimaculis]
MVVIYRHRGDTKRHPPPPMAAQHSSHLTSFVDVMELLPAECNRGDEVGHVVVTLMSPWQPVAVGLLDEYIQRSEPTSS